MKREQQIGKHGEQLAESVLNGLGIELLEKVGTPVKLIPVTHRLRNVFQVIFGERVSADRRGILPNGRSVLIEVKTIMDKNLTWGALRPHQPGALTRHAEFNGLTLLVWVHSSGVYVMLWPILNFMHGKGITPEQAAQKHESTVRYIAALLEQIKQESLTDET